MCRHAREHVATVDAHDDEADADGSWEVDLFTEADDADSCHADDAECGPRPVDQPDWELLERQRDEIESESVADDDADTREPFGEPFREVQAGRSEQFPDDGGTEEA